MSNGKTPEKSLGYALRDMYIKLCRDNGINPVNHEWSRLVASIIVMEEDFKELKFRMDSLEK